MSDFETEHVNVFIRATAIFHEKSELRGQMWLEYPPSDKIREMRERVHRIENAYQHIRFEDTTPGPENPHKTIRAFIIEDALDLLNYVNFFIKQVERGQRG